MTDENHEIKKDPLPEDESEKDTESNDEKPSGSQKESLAQVPEEDMEFEKRLRLGTNQLNIATAFSKEDGDLEQILRYAKEASSIFEELLAVKPDDPGIVPLKKKAERIVIMCTYSPSQLDNLMVEAKELFVKGMEKMQMEHEFQARWFLENCLAKIRPLLIVWGVTSETKGMVEAVGDNLASLDETSALKERKKDEEKIFSMLDRLNLIKDMPIMEILNKETYWELLNMKEFFKRLEEETEVKGLEEIFGDIDSEMYHIYANDIRTAIEETYRINLMEKKPDFTRVNALSDKVRSLNIEESRGDFILSYAEDVKSKFATKINQMNQLNKLIERRGKILRRGLDEVPRAKRLDRLFSEVKGGEDSTGFPIKNKDMIDKIKILLNKAEPEPVSEGETSETAPGDAMEAKAQTEMETGTEPVAELGADKKPVEKDDAVESLDLPDEQLIERYSEMPDGDNKDEINKFLDGITADLIFDTAKYTPTKLTFADDIETVIESLRRQIKSLVSSKAYLPFGKSGNLIEVESKLEKKVEKKGDIAGNLL
jgi:hypothetical protein